MVYHVSDFSFFFTPVQFLVACTAKLDLGSYARILYDWEGQEVQYLSAAPVLDSCLQTSNTPVLGPLWVSKGEGFSPKGVSEFLTGLVTYTNSKLKEAKQYRQQVSTVLVQADILTRL